MLVWQGYMRKLKKLRGYLINEKPSTVIAGDGDNDYTINFDELDAGTFQRACLRDTNADGSFKSFGVYTVYRSALTYQATEQDHTLNAMFKKKVSKWLTGCKKLDATARKEGKKKAQVGKRAMPVDLHRELLGLFQTNGTKKGKYIYQSTSMATSSRIIFNKSPPVVVARATAIGGFFFYGIFFSRTTP